MAHSTVFAFPTLPWTVIDLSVKMPVIVTFSFAIVVKVYGPGYTGYRSKIRWPPRGWNVFVLTNQHVRKDIRICFPQANCMISHQTVTWNYHIPTPSVFSFICQGFGIDRSLKVLVLSILQLSYLRGFNWPFSPKCNTTTYNKYMDVLYAPTTIITACASGR